MEQKVHQGRNVKRFREILGIKQEALAFDLGDDWSQKKVSLLEQKEIINDSLLQKISEIFNIPVEAFQNFSEEQAINIISNSFDQGSIANNNSTNSNVNCTVNPLDKILEFHDDKIALYEKMLKEKDEMILRMEKFLEKGK
nr:helix-turn-helix transcriptional regulator [uncultured Chryseobacterium sp.]